MCAHRRQDEAIREVWNKIDVDQDNNLDQSEIENMAALLDIKLTDQEIEIAMDEMGATERIGVSFERFTNWWLSGSNIAAKVKTAARAKDLVGEKLFRKLVAKNKTEQLDVDDLLRNGRSVFGEVLSKSEAQEIIEEIVEQRGDTAITQEAFNAWWKSDLTHAMRLRKKRRDDMTMARRIVEKFDTAKAKQEDYKADKHAQLDRDEFQEMIVKLKLGTKVDDILAGVARASLEHESVDDLMCEGYVNFVEFFDWLVSDDELAVRTKKAFDLQDEKDRRAKEQPFPFVPWFSVKCRDISYSWRFDGVMTAVILANTVVMALAHHEQEITAPNLSSFMQHADFVFSMIYVLEFVVKFFGMGAVAYFVDHGNKFDFICSAAFVAALLLPNLNGASAFRSLRVLIKCMRVARSAKMLIQHESVQVLLKTILENGERLFLLGMFAIFMLIVFSIIGGHTLGNCHSYSNGTLLDAGDGSELPLLNFFTFSAAFHANFLIMMGEDWSGMLFDYSHCSGTVWIYFVLSYTLLKFFIANLFVALIVDGFCLSEEEKLIKQERNHIEALAEESGILRAMGATGGFDDPMAMVGGAMDTFRGLQEQGFGVMKEMPKARNVMKAMSKGAASKKLSGPMAEAKKKMGRVGDVADKASGGQMSKLKEEAEKRVQEAKAELERQADKAVLAATHAAEEAKKQAERAVEEAQKHAEAKVAELQARIDEGLDDGLSPQERRKQASWHIFGLKHPIRRACIGIVDHPRFERSVLSDTCLPPFCLSVY